MQPAWSWGRASRSEILLQMSLQKAADLGEAGARVSAGPGLPLNLGTIGESCFFFTRAWRSNGGKHTQPGLGAVVSQLQQGRGHGVVGRGFEEGSGMEARPYGHKWMRALSQVHPQPVLPQGQLLSITSHLPSPKQEAVLYEGTSGAA